MLVSALRGLIGAPLAGADQRPLDRPRRGLADGGRALDVIATEGGAPVPPLSLYCLSVGVQREEGFRPLREASPPRTRNARSGQPGGESQRGSGRGAADWPPPALDRHKPLKEPTN